MNKLELIQAVKDKTGEKVQIPAKRLPFFKPGKELRERVDCPTK